MGNGQLKFDSFWQASADLIGHSLTPMWVVGSEKSAEKGKARSRGLA